MKNKGYLCRLPFYCLKGCIKYRLMGDMIDETDEDINVPIDSLVDTHTLPFCIDCFGELGWAELVYGVGARQCMQCGSVFKVFEKAENNE